MGFHICEWCQNNNELNRSHIFQPTSSQDVTLYFESGRVWEFPHPGLLHYVTSHEYRPPDEFIMDVMTSKVVGHQLVQTKGLGHVAKVGYLEYPNINIGWVPPGFVERLSALIRKADWTGNVQTTRGL